MPTYEVTAPDGRTLEIDGPTPPSEAVLAQIFSKMPAPTAPTEQPAPAEPERTWGDTAQDVAIGAAKGLGNTVFGLGKMVRDYTPVGRISDAIMPGAFDQRPPELEPTNTPQSVGYHGEQIAEFFLPVSAAGKAKKAVDVGKAAVTSLAQSGSPAQAGVSGALTAVIPGAGGATKAASALETSAKKSMAQALGATKEWAKAEAQKLAPEMLKRGVGGSREAMLGTAKATASRVNQELNAAYQAAGAAGQTIDGAIINGHLQIARDSLNVVLPNGSTTLIPGTERVAKQLDKLNDFVTKLGPDIPVDQAARVKRTWDHIVSKAGLFGPKATSTATDAADAWAFREATGSFRQLINANPTIEALNKEASFWMGLRNVLTETEKRTQAQSGGLVAAGTGGAGVIAGAMTGDSMSDRAQNAFLGGLAGRQLVKVLQSPAWRTQVSGPLKQQLSEAMASGSAQRVASVTRQIIASLPAQMRPAAAQ